MPPLTMRGRYLMREYWSDSDLFLRLDAAQREVYVGLWMLADDEGWLPRDIPAIAAALFRYVDRAPREAQVRSALARLRDLEKLESHRCGCIYLPAVARYPRAGRKSADHAAEHRSHTKPSKANRPDTKASPDPTFSLPDQTRPSRARARDGSSSSELREKLAAAGLKAEVVW